MTILKSCEIVATLVPQALGPKNYVVEMFEEIKLLLM